MHTPAQKHTHADRAVLRCSIRLSMGLILISRKEKSLLQAVRAGGESSIASLTHTNTKRQPAAAVGLFVKLKDAFIHILCLL